jgi:hypothetical protein
MNHYAALRHLLDALRHAVYASPRTQFMVRDAIARYMTLAAK